MTRRSSERSATIAVVGAASPIGGRLRAALAASGIAGDRVTLFGASRGEAVLGEYDGEARLLQDPVPDEVLGADVVFLCDAAEGTVIATRPRGDARIVDLVGVCEGAPLVHGTLAPPSPDAGVVRVPHALAIVLAEMLEPVVTRLGLVRATVFVIRPAADFGEAGLDELREQTVRLLRFERPPTDVLGRQLAFNLIPQRLLRGERAGLEAELAAQTESLLGGRCRVAIGLVTAPIFHGHVISARLEGLNGSASDVAQALAHGERLEVSSKGGASTPMDAPEERRTIVSEVRPDASGGIWLWAIVAEGGAAAAEQAVVVAGTITEIPS